MVLLKHRTPHHQYLWNTEHHQCLLFETQNTTNVFFLKHRTPLLFLGFLGFFEWVMSSFSMVLLRSKKSCLVLFCVSEKRNSHSKNPKNPSVLFWNKKKSGEAAKETPERSSRVEEPLAVLQRTAPLLERTILVVLFWNTRSESLLAQEKEEPLCCSSYETQKNPKNRSVVSFASRRTPRTALEEWFVPRVSERSAFFWGSSRRAFCSKKRKAAVRKEMVPFKEKRRKEKKRKEKKRSTGFIKNE